jgi:hypothetical protein
VPKYIPRLRGLIDAKVERELVSAFEQMYSYLDQRIKEFAKLGSPISSADIQRIFNEQAPILLNQLVIPLIGEQVDDALTQIQLTPDENSLFQLKSEKGQANGYASLDGTTTVPVAQLGSGVADATTFLRGDRTWAVPPVGGGAGGNTVLDYMNFFKGVF